MSARREPEPCRKCNVLVSKVTCQCGTFVVNCDCDRDAAHIRTFGACPQCRNPKGPARYTRGEK